MSFHSAGKTAPTLKKDLSSARPSFCRMHRGPSSHFTREETDFLRSHKDCSSNVCHARKTILHNVWRLKELVRPGRSADCANRRKLNPFCFCTNRRRVVGRSCIWIPGARSVRLLDLCSFASVLAGRGCGDHTYTVILVFSKLLCGFQRRKGQT